MISPIMARKVRLLPVPGGPHRSKLPPLISVIQSFGSAQGRTTCG